MQAGKVVDFPWSIAVGNDPFPWHDLLLDLSRRHFSVTFEFELGITHHFAHRRFDAALHLVSRTIGCVLSACVPLLFPLLLIRMGSMSAESH